MGTARAMVVTRPLLALALVLLAITARVLVPAGFMPERIGDRLTLALCTGHGPMVMASASNDGADAHRHGSAKGGGKDGLQVDQPCGFAGVAAALGAGDDIALPIAAVVLGSLSKVAPGRPTRARPSDRLRPPLRGPPGAAAAS